ncbi:hypothetical protein M7I_1093 [Glarea lozoyensis 74030]|uniref:Uncharacterized protein n=1 Tax=Glarea lozoyensis (strain ATCC 74030 / MF5533) TaxID=1104152 RepID=H0EF55_GLAL7|nr:hypothetical protein M7I_1093 [Glarea lozoyensis 74030]
MSDLHLNGINSHPDAVPRSSTLSSPFKVTSLNYIVMKSCSNWVGACSHPLISGTQWINCPSSQGPRFGDEKNCLPM